MKKLLEYAGSYRRYTYAAVAVLLLGTLCSVLPFLLLYQLIAPLLTGAEMPLSYYMGRVLLILLCTVLHSLLYTKGLALSHISAFHTLENIRVSLQNKLEQQPLGVIREKGTGTLKKMFIDDIDDLELLLAHALPEGAANLTVPLVVLAAIFFVDWRLGLLSLCSLPLGMIAMGAMYRSGMSKMAAYYDSARKMNDTIVEFVNGMEVVKVFNRDGESMRRYEKDVTEYRDFTLDWFKACWPWMAVYSSVLPCIAMFSLPVGAWMVLNGTCTLADFCLTLCMSFGIGAPLVRAMNFGPTIPQITFKLNELEKLTQAPPLQQKDAPFSGKDYSVSLQDVTFSYEEKEVLQHVSLTIPEGAMVALVGESGSGKSTLAKLLVHFYDVKEGTVSIGGQDIRDMSLESLNRQISYVAQEQFLFHTTLRENIRMGRPDATDEEVLQAAEQAQCGEFLQRLEKGIDSMAGDSGKMLSGGERQRISLARAILKNAPIVVLDEATAFMDPENEEKMNRAIAQVIRGKTVIVIAHRLPSIMHADKICVMHQGRLEAEGRHEELLAGCKTYQTLWKAAEESSAWSITGEEVPSHV